MRYFIFLLFLSIMSLDVFSRTASEPTEPQPSLVLGVGLGGQYIHDYRGSKSTSFEVLPFPFIRYSSDFLKIDRNGARGNIIDANNFELNLSADLALNGDDEDNMLRQNMPKLDTVLQLGPSVDINLTGKNLDEGLSLRMPLRAAFAVSLSHIDAIGYNFAPKLTYRFMPYQQWHIKTDVGVLYASQKFHDYYYSVLPEFVTQTRTAFAAKAGYSGAFAKISAVKFQGNWLWGVSIRYDNLSNTAFINSPLVETNDHFVVSIAVAKMLYKRQ